VEHGTVKECRLGQTGEPDAFAARVREVLAADA
jgi:hypothetical protein